MSFIVGKEVIIMKKKKVLKYCVIAVISVAVFFSIVLAHYFLTTTSVQGCIDYCVENSQRSATTFIRIGDPRHVEEYAYFIAADGDPSKPQEIFVFREKFFGSSSYWDRYVFVMSSTQATGNVKSGKGYGSLRFFAKNDHDETEKGATLIYFGASKESDIFGCEYTVTIPEGSLTGRKKALKDNYVWSISFFDLCNTDHTAEKEISDVRFYDYNGNPIE